MITLDDVKKAQTLLKGVIQETPLTHSMALSSPETQVFLKLENLQKTGSFKIRGAYNKIASLNPEEKENGVIASSAGNHAQGVALSAKELGIKAVICMPATAPLAKVNNTKSYGAEVILHGTVYDDCYTKALEVQKERNLTFVHPFDDDAVIAGQGTIALEILKEQPQLEALVVPIGGGGIISGIALAAKTLNPNIKIIGVQTENIPGMKNAINCGDVCIYQTNYTTIADGIAVKKPGAKTFEMVKKYVDDIITVNEEEIATAILFLMEKHQVVVEGAGAVTTAAQLAGKLPSTFKSMTLVVSGGNIDINRVAQVIDQGLMNSGRRFNFTITLNDKVGQMETLTHTLSELKANIFSINATRIHRDVPLGHQFIDVVVETSNEEHKQEVINNLKEKGYIIHI